MAGPLSGTGYGAWEQRRFWRTGLITKIEWWRGGQLVRHASTRAVRAALILDYCEAHYTRIYADLACPYCHEQPRASKIEAG